ncbi:MAG: MBL fold metallo-hydrolase [Lachnospiraceae bacterium]|nr:MBL fold metallo-hydrolase [Lachnospiraceae bacterium]
MRITFLGATHEVTGSMTYLEVGAHKYLVDCGMEQGKDIFVNQSLPVKAAEIEAVFLTHAHIDHSGNIPLLYKEGFRGSVYASEATVNLCRIMLLDSASIQETEADWQNRKNARAGKGKAEPIYTIEDAQESLRLFVPLPFDQETQVGENVVARFGDAGHLLGASHIELWLTESGETRKIVFSGDVGNSRRPLIRDPQPVEDADYVVLESTYGTRLHGSHEGNLEYVMQLAAIFEETFSRGGNVIIPSFAVGRTQELLYTIRQIKEEQMVPALPDFRVILDSPLAVEATAVFQQTERSYFNEEAQALLDAGKNPVYFEGLEVSVSTEESKAINFDPQPKVIISASGMCEAGRIRHHLKHNLWRPECTIMFVGFQTVGTLGRALLDGAETVKLFGEDISVKAQLVSVQGISGHADRDGLTAWLKPIKNPKMVFINHGDDEVVTEFAAYLKEEFGYNTAGPFSGAIYDLLEDKWIAQPEGIPIDQEKAEKSKADTVWDALVAAAQKLLSLAKNMKGRANKEIQNLTKDIEKLLKKYQEQEEEKP